MNWPDTKLESEGEWTGSVIWLPILADFNNEKGSWLRVEFSQIPIFIIRKRLPERGRALPMGYSWIDEGLAPKTRIWSFGINYPSITVGHSSFIIHYSLSIRWSILAAGLRVCIASKNVIYCRIQTGDVSFARSNIVWAKCCDPNSDCHDKVLIE